MNYMKSLLCFIGPTLIVILLSCSGSRWASKIGWSDFDLESIPDQQDYPEAGAVILLDEAILEMFPMGEHTFSEMRHHTIVKILNERGMKHANVLIAYSPDTEVSKIRARTILPDGQIITLMKNMIFDTNLYPDYIFYSDIRAKRFTMPAVEEGCIVEYSYHTAVKNFTFWPRWRFQKEDPVLISRYTIRCPSEWDILWKAYDIDVRPESGQAYKGMKISRTWEVRDLPALIPEPAMPNGMRYIPNIMFSPVGVRTWDGLAGWYNTTVADRMKSNSTVRRFTESLLTGASDPDEKLRRIYEFVRDHIRYVAIEIGIGGYRPHFAEEVLKNRYGDCKDMTTLIVAMAEAADLKVKPVLISTWYHGEADTVLVSLSHFDHMIAVVEKPDGNRIWMDPTEKFIPFGKLPWYDRNRIVVVIGKEASIYRTPAMTFKENIICRNWQVNIQEAGTWDGMVTFLVQGAPAMELRHHLNRIPVPGIDDFFIRDLLRSVASADVQNIEVAGLNDLKGPCTAVIHFTSSDTIPKIDSRVIYNISDFCESDLHILYQHEQRKYPIDLKYPVQSLDHLTLVFPDTWKLISPIREDSVLLDFGSFKQTMHREKENRLNWSRKYDLYYSSVEAGRYEDFQYLMKRLSLADQVPIVFSPP